MLILSQGREFQTWRFHLFNFVFLQPRPSCFKGGLHWINRYPIDFGTTNPVYNSIYFGSAYVAQVFTNDSLQAIDLHQVQGQVEILS